MKVWFDISNSPHVNMFLPFIEDLKKMGHDIIITSRPLANTIQLLEQAGLKHTIIGQHYGKNLLKKLLGFPVRIFQLVKFLKLEKPDIAVSQSSFHSPLTSKILGIPSLYTNDNENALGNYLAFPFATKILLPESLVIQGFPGYKIFSKKIVTYPGVKEGIYLWSKSHLENQHAKKHLLGRPRIYVRPEPRTAQYYNVKNDNLDKLILQLQEQAYITILTRDKVQYNHYSSFQFSKINLPTKPIHFDHITQSCDLFIGAGGSMTRELAVMGIPTVSIYQSKLLSVDNYLLENRWLIYDKELSCDRIDKILLQLSKKDTKELIEKGKAAYNILMNLIIDTSSIHK